LADRQFKPQDQMSHVGGLRHTPLRERDTDRFHGEPPGFRTVGGESALFAGESARATTEF